MQTQKSKIVNLAIALFVMILPWPHLALAQQPQKGVHRIGALLSEMPSSFNARNEVFKQSLHELGYVEGYPD
jgi:hypothetical protein